MNYTCVLQTASVYRRCIARLPVASTMLLFWATMSKQRSTLSKGQNFKANSFDTVAVFGNKVERCFDIVAGVDRA